jgi:hypothetical protein
MAGFFPTFNRYIKSTARSVTSASAKKVFIRNLVKVEQRSMLNKKRVNELQTNDGLKKVKWNVLFVFQL